jgi:DNA (cytosine-5)-methyltransferase 1
LHRPARNDTLAPGGESRVADRPGFYEFFCGGGMARAGLGEAWECLFANDIDAKKARSYAANWGDEALCVANIHELAAKDLRGRADLAWASFPCQDLSLAGAGAGLAGARSGAFWGFHALMKALSDDGRAPRLIALENVVGALTSNGGADFVEICRTLQRLGYVFGALTIDAAHFLPQSRPRLFIVAARADLAIPSRLASPTPSPLFASRALLRAHALLDPDIAAAWRWWILPDPPRANLRLPDMIESAPADVAWRSDAQTEAMIAIMSAGSQKKLAEARAEGGVRIGALYRRTRPDGEGGRRMRAEARFDGHASCLRTPGGGSSRQFLLWIEGAKTRSRLMSAREAARLMGLAEDYRLPPRYNDAYHLIGDGVAVPAVRFLSETLLTPLLAAQDAVALAAAQ